MSKTWDVVLHADYSPNPCAAKLSEQIDIDRRTLFALSGYKGSKPIVGCVAGNEFRLHRRRYWHTSFGPVVFGRISSEGRGSLVEALWDMARWPRTLLRGMMIVSIVVGIPASYGPLKCALEASCSLADHWWIGPFVPVFMLIWCWSMPRRGGALSFHERKPIEDLLKKALVAGIAVHPRAEREWQCSLDDYGQWSSC